MKTFKRLLKMVKPYTGRLIWAILCMVLTALLNSGIALMVKPLMDDIFMNKRWVMLQLIPIGILLLYFLKGVFDYAQVYLMNYIGQRVIMELRNELFAHIHRLSHRFFADHSTGMLISRMNQDVILVQNVVSEAVANLIRDPLDIIAYLGALIYLNWRWAVASLLVFPFVAVLIDRLGKKLRRITVSAQERISDLTIIMHETITGAAIVKAFMMEEREKEKFEKANKAYFNDLMRSVRVIALSTPLMEFMGAAALAVILWYGGLQVFRGRTTPGTFFAFVTALLMLYGPIKRLIRVNNQIQQGIAGAERAFEILDTEPEIISQPGARELKPMRQVIRYQEVGFGYREKKVLKEINFEVRKGEVIAIVGESGVGKTTLVNLLLRFYDVTAGAILIDGQDIRDVDLASLRKQIGLVTQETILFNDTVRNNIAYGNMDASQRQIEAAARAAFAHHFINRLPDKYLAVIGERGVMLSGGQRQRLAIARAILKNPPILILDEATSALDTQSERVVQRALENLMQNRTTFVIAHRLSTVQHADRIIVLDEGRIVEMGTHQELLKNQGAYHYLYTLQFHGT